MAQNNVLAFSRGAVILSFEFFFTNWFYNNFHLTSNSNGQKKLAVFTPFNILAN
jgi:hypothetical protein